MVPIPFIAYVYLILTITGILNTILAAIKRDETMFEVFIGSTPLFFIGFISFVNNGIRAI